MPRFRPDPDWPRLPAEWNLVEVAGVAIDANDNIYLFSRGNPSLSILDPAGSVLAAWGNDIFTLPHGIDVDDRGSVWCADYGDHTVRRFSAAGELEITLGTPGLHSDTGCPDRDWRKIVRAAGPFNSPTDVAFGPDGKVFISDGYGNARIHVFASSGELIGGWGAPGAGPGEFNLPHSISLGPNGVLYVSDRENSRVQLFASDGSFRGTIGGIHRPDDAYPAPDGLLYVAELGYRTVQALKRPAPEGRPHSAIAVLTMDGEILGRFGTDDPGQPGSFQAAHSMVMDARGDLYIADVGWSATVGNPPSGYRPIQKLVRSE